ncbi:MAG TPA: glycosyltransferase [Tepidisphaeraceae bacterium]|jgi:glycosyltransferase involved in cell wall biosynthesis|nr:glycosyltransferase [Tepidisphaeraceae bacterium]
MLQSVSILICTHNRADILRRTLQSLAELCIPAQSRFEVIVVGNACTDHTDRVVDAAKADIAFPVRYVVENQIGLSIARNRAIQAATGQIMAFLDDDVWVEPDWAIELLRVYHDYPADVVGGRVDLWWESGAAPEWLNPGYYWLLSACNHGNKTFRMRDGIGAIGANFSFRGGVLSRIGGFREDLGRIGNEMLAGEETDFVERAMAAGFKAFHVPSVRVRHWVPASRATPEYLASAMRGTARSRAIMKHHFGLWNVVRSVGGNLYLLARFTAGEWGARLGHSPPVTLRNHFQLAACKGALAGSFYRLVSGRGKN